jgi:hypothetical protein
MKLGKIATHDHPIWAGISVITEICQSGCPVIIGKVDDFSSITDVTQ